MQTKNQISLTRKALYGIMLLGVFLSVFGGGICQPPTHNPKRLPRPSSFQIGVAMNR